MMHLAPIVLVLVLALAASGACAQEPKTFTNPFITSSDAPDPWVIRHEGFYYLTATFEPDGGLWIWKSPTLTSMDNAEKVKVWTAPATGPQSKQIWAPELYHFNGRWYLYYTASDGPNRNHRHFVLESETDDALGPYIDRGLVDPELDSYAIDGSVLITRDNQLYWLYTTGTIDIAPMLSPTQVDGTQRATLARPDRPWERNWIEAPQPLVHGDRIFIIYSAGHSATPHYALGMLTHNGGDLLDPANWTKSPAPVFAPVFTEHGAVYTVGHNCFTKSPDGREDWIIYHAKDWTHLEKPGFAHRTARMQPFTWTEDGRPHFGSPIPAGLPLPVPSGE